MVLLFILKLLELLHVSCKNWLISIVSWWKRRKRRRKKHFFLVKSERNLSVILILEHTKTDAMQTQLSLINEWNKQKIIFQILVIAIQKLNCPGYFFMATYLITASTSVSFRGG